jgi:hypothetical protein
MTAKEQAVSIISKLPDEATANDIVSELSFRLKVEIGLRQLDAGEGIENEDVKRRLARWLA